VAIEATRPRPRLPPTGVTFAARGEASGSVDRSGSAVTGGGPLEDQLEVLAPLRGLIRNPQGLIVASMAQEMLLQSITP
jgi:hypothetical protein